MILKYNKAHSDWSVDHY